MSKNAFDDLLRKKMDEQELPYQEDQWERLAGQLPSESKRDRKFLFATIALGTAAAIALLLASVLLYRFIDQKPEAEGPRPLAGVAVQSPDAAGSKQQSEKIGAADDAASRRNPSDIARQTESNLVEARPHDTPALATNSPADGVSAADLPAKDPAKAAPTREPAQPQTRQHIAVAPAREQANDPTTRVTLPPPGVPLPGQATGVTAAPQTRIAIGAGMNYGTINAGYSIGVTAKQELGNHFFVEGTVALMYNNNVNNSGDYSGPTHVAARPTMGAINSGASPVFTPTQNLYYVQFNPSFGYQLGDRFSFSIGGDIQQLISGNDQKVLVRPNALLFFPELDFGITGKTDFKVAPHIHAGLIFREGLNNFLLSQPDKYVNRRYFEVQFKYSIPVQ